MRFLVNGQPEIFEHLFIVLFNPYSVAVTASEIELSHRLAQLSSQIIVFQHLIKILLCSETLGIKISYGCQRFRMVLRRGETVIMECFFIILFHTVAKMIHGTKFILCDI